ncbi:MAG: protein kinase domain-containing protein [Longimicrobiales bacterium]
MSIDRLTIALADRYRVEREIGSGGMATVYLAEDLRHNRRVAIKVLRPELAAALGAERFIREIQIAAQLTHPHILPLHDSGEADGLLYYVMPYVDGISLRDRLKREKQLPIDDALGLAHEVADALAHAHARGILHRDIKPQNILIAGQHALVVDFGIARAVDQAGGQQLTQTGFVVGTSGYCSPEQMTGEEELDARTDVYSLGCVLYEMLTGQPPFTGATVPAMLARQLAAPVPSVRSQRDSVPENVDRAVTRALARLRADRFATAEQFAAALTPTAMQSASARGRPRKTILAATTLAVAGLIAFGFNLGGVRDVLLQRFGTGASNVARQRPSLVVLPFENVGGNPDEEYFSDGLTEELIAALSQLRALRVAARTSSFAFKNQAPDIREIGKALDVKIVLSGSVRRSGNRVRVTAQLVDAATGLDMWSQTYEEDRPVAEIFDIQSELALRIAQALEMNLSASERGQLEHKPTENLEAYQLYLKGRYFFNRRGTDLFTGVDYFEKAIALDSQFAKAWAGLASAYAPLGGHSYVHPRVARERMREAVQRAVALDDQLGDAHGALGSYYQTYEWNWAAAEKAYLRALEVDPNNSLAHNWYGFFLENMGRFDEALAERQRSQQAEPLARTISSANALRLAGRFNLAEAQYRDIIAYNPEYWQFREGLGRLYEATGRVEQAIPEYEAAVKYANATPRAKASLAHALARAGKTAQARWLLDSLRADAARTDIYDPIVAAPIFALGDTAGALQWLEASYRQRHPWLVTINVDERFKRLRGDARFQHLLRRIGFRQ